MNMPTKAGRTILVAAGGTGGHLFPAQALSEELIARGYRVELATDERGESFHENFPASAVHVLPSETLRSRAPMAMLNTFWTLARGFIKAFRLLGRVRPAVVVGFGGYPTLPPVMAARYRRVPILLHEQNAVMGRANRMLGRHARAIATSFPEIALVDDELKGKLRYTGNPVRQRVMEAAEEPYDAPRPGGEARLLIFGGSQGARIFTDVVPGALARLSNELKSRFRIVQQARREDVKRLAEAYEKVGIQAEVAAFFDDLPQRIANAHLVIARSGASTVSEVALIGRPAILVPLPGSLDNDQLMNASAMAKRGAARLMSQSAFTPNKLADALARLLSNLDELPPMAVAARGLGRPNAAKRLADLVEALADGKLPSRKKFAQGDQ